SSSARTRSLVASTDPSSTTTSSRSRSVWPSTLATASSTVRSASRAARTTDTRAGATARRGEPAAVAEAASDLRFDLVVATVERTDDLDSLLSSLDAQTHRAFRVVVVD